ncbi:MAG TPA: DUF2157 domain-containing protein [Candidatus Angelobacter sp.]|nr:DUF2157 domain-containing protein [Candidatus Angelobacter sp.]
MDDLEARLQRWSDAQIIDSVTAGRIREYESTQARRHRRWPVILAVSFGALMLCAGVLLFVAAHWDELAPANRFVLVLAMVAIFHVAVGLLGRKVEALGTALHVAGTVALGGGIFLAGQIFNLEEHWPGGLMLWSLGALLAWLVLRQWPQAVLAAVLVPAWLVGEWEVAAGKYTGSGVIAAQGLLLLAIFYLSMTAKGPQRPLRLALIWVGALALLPCILGVVLAGEWFSWRTRNDLPAHLRIIGYCVAYLPVLIAAILDRKKASSWLLGAAIWVYGLRIAGFHSTFMEPTVWIYLWLALGAAALCTWGVRVHRKLFINFGVAIFSLTVITFYFSNRMDKLGRSMGLILLGAIFLAGGWILHRLRTDLIARATAGGNR